MKQERSGKNCQFQMYRWTKYIFNLLQYLLRMPNVSNYSKAMQTGCILGIFTNKRRIPQNAKNEIPVTTTRKEGDT